jgi:hypothetical protein
VATLFPALLAQYGEELSYGSGSTRTIGAFWNDAEKTSVYAAIYGTRQHRRPTADRWPSGLYLLVAERTSPLPLTAGDIAGVAELSAEELAGLDAGAGGDVVNALDQHLVDR